MPAHTRRTPGRQADGSLQPGSPLLVWMPPPSCRCRGCSPYGCPPSRSCAARCTGTACQTCRRGPPAGMQAVWATPGRRIGLGTLQARLPAPRGADGRGGACQGRLQQPKHGLQASAGAGCAPTQGQLHRSRVGSLLAYQPSWDTSGVRRIEHTKRRQGLPLPALALRDPLRHLPARHLTGAISVRQKRIASSSGSPMPCRAAAAAESGTAARRRLQGAVAAPQHPPALPPPRDSRWAQPH